MNNSLKLIHLAKNYLNQNNLDQAKKLLLLAIDSDPFNQQANELIASIYELEGDLDTTREYLVKACSISDPNPESLYKLGAICLQLNLYVDAKKALISSLEIGGEIFEVLHDLGVVYAGLGELEKSKFYFQKAGQLKNNSPILFFNLGKAHHDLGEFNDAIICYENCLNLDHKFLPALYSKADALKEMNKLDEAINCYDEIFRLRPNETDALCGVSTLYLLRGDYQIGWAAYSHRWKQMPAESYRYKNLRELKSTTTAEGNNLLVWHEQGLGDSIQFSRYIHLLIKKGFNVTFQVQEPLETFFRKNFSCKIISNTPNADKFDFQIPLLNLPKIFNTELSNIPLTQGYLKADRQKVEYWKNQVPLSSKKYNIAIAISGNPNHINDKNRSVSLNYFKNLAEVAHLFILQKELNESDIQFLKLNESIVFFGDRIQNFDDSAAIIELMDLVISVDTALIHLAGAQKKKAFLILPHVPEWRWLTKRPDSPWYESVQIFRQNKKGDWQPVIDQIYNKLINITNT